MTQVAKVFQVGTQGQQHIFLGNQYTQSFVLVSLSHPDMDTYVAIKIVKNIKYAH